VTQHGENGKKNMANQFVKRPTELLSESMLEIEEVLEEQIHKASTPLRLLNLGRFSDLELTLNSL